MKVLSLSPDGSFVEIDLASATSQTFYQSIPSTDWKIVHNFGRKPNVTVLDSTNSEVDCPVQHTDDNELHVLPGAEFSGSVILTV